MTRASRKCSPWAAGARWCAFPQPRQPRLRRPAKAAKSSGARCPSARMAPVLTCFITGAKSSEWSGGASAPTTCKTPWRRWRRRNWRGCTPLRPANTCATTGPRRGVWSYCSSPAGCVCTTTSPTIPPPSATPSPPCAPGIPAAG